MSGSRSTLPAASLARVVVFAAFIAVLGLFPGIGGVAGVPIVVQNVGPILAGAILGWKLGTASVALLLGLTAIGLPLLSGGRGGLAPFVGPSAGFVFGWLLSALVTGLIVQRARKRTLPILLLACFAGLLADYLIGIPVLGAYVGDLGAGLVQSLVFVPGDVVKVVLAAVIAGLVHRALPDLLPAPASGSRGR
ncbi:biotin transporter BioY [Pseudonocardia parietis]|uniref:Biotin transporter n=1 Tax=Pseudonocardia parietis TaxID=570936 RepID=A0ABS4VL73_9PSEU|nr:biotin transporter BioY [Pseudonocardia parietis]MBP2364669.1 biotin transport system substrate-specific component [Pseudonocardia parietis]